jgi:chemotaxis signal transduction protein
MVAGVANVHGVIVPVLDGGTVVRIDAPPPREGDALVLLDVEGVRAGIAVERIDAVTTLSPSDAGLIDPKGQSYPLLDCPGIIAVARRQVVSESGDGSRP